jgi:DnaK suppressor protein
MTIAPSRSPAIDLAASRALLEGLYLELTAEIEEAMSVAAATAGTWSGEDEADVGTRASQQEQQLTVVSSIRAKRDQIENALLRLEAGSYGLCETCGDPIPLARLEACPSCTECVTCKRAHEGRA